jgi:adenylate cyclase
VLCAAEIQQALKQHVVNGDVPLTLRIGINLGDVIVQDDDIYGDGVNVAARLESIAERVASVSAVKSPARCATACHIGSRIAVKCN